MRTYDVVVVGAGPAGLTAGALLASEGRRVVVIEASSHLGGRAVERADDGYMIQLGGHRRAPGINGLYFASETFRSRGIGIDRAARAALTTVEDYLGRRIRGLGDTWRYSAFTA